MSPIELSWTAKKQDRSDKVEIRLKPNPAQGPKAKKTSNNQLPNW